MSTRRCRRYTLSRWFVILMSATQPGRGNVRQHLPPLHSVGNWNCKGLEGGAWLPCLQQSFWRSWRLKTQQIYVKTTKKGWPCSESEKDIVRQSQTNPLRTEVALQNLEWVTNFGLDADSLKSHPGESAYWHKNMQFMDVCLCLWVFIWILNDSYVCRENCQKAGWKLVEIWGL